MAEPLRIRFATDTAGAKAGMQDLAASVVSNMVKVSGAVAQHAEAAGAASSKLTAAFGTGAQGVATAATTIVRDVGAIGAAGIKAANDTGVSGVAIGAALGKAAAQTQTAAVTSQASLAALGAQASFTMGVVRNEVAQTSAILRSSPLFAPAVVAVGGVLALTASIIAMEAAAAKGRDEMEAIMKMAARARDAGVGVSFFQRWLGEAKALNIEVSKLERMLTTARAASTTRLGENGKTSNSAIEERLGEHASVGNITRTDAARFGTAKSEEERYRVMLDLMEKLRAKGADLAAFDLAGKFFGPDFENGLRNGVDMIAKMKADLESTSAVTAEGNRVISPEEVERADKLHRTLEATKVILGNALAPITKDISGFMADAAQGAADFSAWLAKAAKHASDAYVWLKGVLEAVDKVTGKDPLGSLATTLGADWLRRGNGIPNWGPGGTEVQGPPAPPEPMKITVNPRRDTSRSLPKPSGRSGSGSGETDPIESYINGLERSTAALKAETEAYGKSAAEKQRSINFARAEELAKQKGVALTQEQIDRLNAAGDATGRYRDQLAALQQQTEQNREAMRAFGQIGLDAITDMALEGKSLDDVLSSVAKQLAKAALQAAIMGTGPLAGLLGTAGTATAGDSNPAGGLIGAIGSFFSGIGKNAEGTDNWRGGLSWVGEKGPELLNLPRGAQVIPNHIAARASGPTKIDNSRVYSIDARGAQAGVADQIVAAIRAHDAEINRTFGERQAAWRQNA